MSNVRFRQRNEFCFPPDLEKQRVRLRDEAVNCGVDHEQRGIVRTCQQTTPRQFHDELPHATGTKVMFKDRFAEFVSPRVPSAEAAEMRDAIPAMGSDAPKGVPIRDLLVLVASLNLCVLVQQLPRMLPRPCLSRLLRRSGVHCTQSSHRLGTGFLAPCRPF